EHGGYYAPLATVRAHGQVTFGQHTLPVCPQQGWERLKVGAGIPLLRTVAWLARVLPRCGGTARGASSRYATVRVSSALMNEEAGEPMGVQEGRTRLRAQDAGYLGSHLRLHARHRTDADRP